MLYRLITHVALQVCKNEFLKFLNSGECLEPEAKKNLKKKFENKADFQNVFQNHCSELRKTAKIYIEGKFLK